MYLAARRAARATSSTQRWYLKALRVAQHLLDRLGMDNEQDDMAAGEDSPEPTHSLSLLSNQL